MRNDDPENDGPDGGLLTTFQAARRLGVVFSTVNGWVDAGILPGFRTPGGHRRIRRADLEAFKVAHRFDRPGPRERRILLVEDDRGFRRALKRRLDRAGLGAAIVEADNGFDAGRLVVEVRPEIVLLDLNLPGIDGFEVMRRIASLAHRPRVVAISGDASAARRRRALELGAAAFFAKPLETAPLIELLRASLGHGPERPRRRNADAERTKAPRRRNVGAKMTKSPRRRKRNGGRESDGHDD